MAAQLQDVKTPSVGLTRKHIQQSLESVAAKSGFDYEKAANHARELIVGLDIKNPDSILWGYGNFPLPNIDTEGLIGYYFTPLGILTFGIDTQENKQSLSSVVFAATRPDYMFQTVSFSRHFDRDDQLCKTEIEGLLCDAGKPQQILLERRAVLSLSVNARIQPFQMIVHHDEKMNKFSTLQLGIQRRGVLAEVGRSLLYGSDFTTTYDFLKEVSGLQV